MIYNLHQFIVSPSSNRKRRDWKPIFWGLKRQYAPRRSSCHVVWEPPSQALRNRGFPEVVCRVLNFATDVPKGRDFLQVHGCESTSILSSHIQVLLGSSKSGSKNRSQCVSRSFQPLFNRVFPSACQAPSIFQKVFEGFGVF